MNIHARTCLRVNVDVLSDENLCIEFYIFCNRYFQTALKCITTHITLQLSDWENRCFNRIISWLAPIPISVRESRIEQEEKARANPHLMKAMEENKREGLELAVRARWIALVIIAFLLPVLNPTWSVLFYEVLLLLFALIGWAQLRWGKVGVSRFELLLVFADLLLLTLITIVPNPFLGENWPTAMQYRFENFHILFRAASWCDAGIFLAHSNCVGGMDCWPVGL